MAFYRYGSGGGGGQAAGGINFVDGKVMEIKGYTGLKPSGPSIDSTTKSITLYLNQYYGNCYGIILDSDKIAPFSKILTKASIYDATAKAALFKYDEDTGAFTQVGSDMNIYTSDVTIDVSSPGIYQVVWFTTSSNSFNITFTWKFSS